MAIPGRREYFCRLLWITGFFLIGASCSREDIAGDCRSQRTEENNVVELWEGIAALARLTTKTSRAATVHADFWIALVRPCSVLRQVEKVGESGCPSEHSARGPRRTINVNIRAYI
ncbi:hypothetical protein CH063_06027 [Colletotrichum higginsianum]|uniref:Secreted protein n=1 Tax=Colletotrichum higginsianum (strain IMI 349063) TaxID=759273 RepID=H1V113_COLHI|nr:hypothetical protein CH063_06027 [Colletotrichum higginsianum]